MKSSRLFVHLIRFHFQSVPWYLWLLVVFMMGIVFFISGISDRDGIHNYNYSYHDRDQFSSIFYIFILATQLTWGMQWGKQAACSQSWVMGSNEFLFTRALDRSVLYWAKLFLFCSICLLPLVPNAIRTAIQPDVYITLSQRMENFQPKIDKYLQGYPDLTVKDRLVTLPAASWDVFAISLFKITLIVLSILWLSQIAKRWPKVWILAMVLFLLAIFIPLLAMRYGGAFKGFRVPEDEDILIWFRLYGNNVWGLLLPLAAVVVWDSRRRFLNQPISFARSGT